MIRTYDGEFRLDAGAGRSRRRLRLERDGEGALVAEFGAGRRRFLVTLDPRGEADLAAWLRGDLTGFGPEGTGGLCGGLGGSLLVRLPGAPPPLNLRPAERLAAAGWLARRARPEEA